MKNQRLTNRLVIGTLLAAAVFLIARYASLPLVGLLVVAWSVLATLEFLGLLRRAEIHLSPWFLGILNAAVVIAAGLGWLPGFILAPIALVFVGAVALAARPRVPVYSAFAVIYLGFLPAHLVMLKRAVLAHSLSNWLVFFPLLLTWTNDTAAWIAGKLFGRHKLLPVLSPNKTWEGFLSGLVASGLLAALYLRVFAPLSALPWSYLAAIGVGLGALSQTGDLFESIFKRAVSVKDSSSVLGEHGGFLDRVDSLLFTIPAWYYLLRLYLR